MLATKNSVRKRFWPLSARSTTRQILRKCIVCFKNKPSISQAIMGNLPKDRVTVNKSFSHAGIDYAGPVFLKEGKRRNAKISKAYIAIFICFSTKALHIELVSDLTSNAFLATLKRFIARRGKRVCIYSDNATTFVDAYKQVREFYEFIHNNEVQNDIKRLLRLNETSWQFIPPNAPHFGGLWKSAVKSAKFHLHRVVRDASLTFEEMSTVLCEIEAVLNSRPLTPMSSDPNDLSCITPGHFLIGTALNSFPTPDLTDSKEGTLLRWQRVEQIRQHFWKRWSSEYLNTLTERHKWKITKGYQLKLGQLVLIQQAGFGPTQWPLGRVQQIHPGADGIARTATVRTIKGILVRPLTKLAILPLDCDN